MTNVELNRAVEDGSIKDIIRVAEARQCKILSKVADDICSRSDVRLVLVSGGSAAGKTTTAKRICTQLGVNDRASIHLSTDDYYLGNDKTPRNEKGELDYEHVECVEIDRLVADINALCRGEAVPIRRFDFPNHKPYTLEKCLHLPKGGMIVLEGIHALNPRLTEGVPDEAKYRVFVEPKPSLTVLGSYTLQPPDARFIRRMVRDAQFRKILPVKTVNLWMNVLAGEKKWIDPYRDRADWTFDSYLVYELAVLKPYVYGLLEWAGRELGNVLEILTLIELLEKIEGIPPDVIPGDSIIRETIGGSQLEY